MHELCIFKGSGIALYCGDLTLERSIFHIALLFFVRFNQIKQEGSFILIKQFTNNKPHLWPLLPLIEKFAPIHQCGELVFITRNTIVKFNELVSPLTSGIVNVSIIAGYTVLWPDWSEFLAHLNLQLSCVCHDPDIDWRHVRFFISRLNL